MKVTKKEQWAPIVIELETAKELRMMREVLSYTIARVGWLSPGQDFASKLNHELTGHTYEVSK